MPPEVLFRAIADSILGLPHPQEGGWNDGPPPRRLEVEYLGPCTELSGFRLDAYRPSIRYSSNESDGYVDGVVPAFLLRHDYDNQISILVRLFGLIDAGRRAYLNPRDGSPYCGTYVVEGYSEHANEHRSLLTGALRGAAADIVSMAMVEPYGNYSLLN